MMAPRTSQIEEPAGTSFTATKTSEGTLVSVGSTRVLVPYSPEFVTSLSRLRPGLDLIDELLRSEHEPYLHVRLGQLLANIPRRESLRLLDFGTGAGGSAVVLARLGFRDIVGIDIVSEYGPLWRRRLDEAGFPGVGSFQLVDENRPLSLPSESFDVMLLNGVLEHLLPEERRFVLEEARRVLRPGGILAIAETPNRWFPRNSHTKLWFSEFLPAALAAKAAVAFGIRGDFPRQNRVAQYRTGFRGMSESQIKKLLGPTMRALPTSPTLARDEFELPRNPLQSSTGRSRMGGWLWRLVALAAKAFRRPPSHFAPHLNLLFEKQASA